MSDPLKPGQEDPETACFDHLHYRYAVPLSLLVSSGERVPAIRSGCELPSNVGSVALTGLQCGASLRRT